MATYRLKSKIFSEFDSEKKDKGILGTGISGGQALLLGATALAGRKMYNNHLVRSGNASATLMAKYKAGNSRQRGMVAQGLKTQRSAMQMEANQRIAAAKTQAGVDKTIHNVTHGVKMNQVQNALDAANAMGATKKATREMASQAYNGYNPEF